MDAEDAKRVATMRPHLLTEALRDANVAQGKVLDTVPSSGLGMTHVTKMTAYGRVEPVLAVEGSDRLLRCRNEVLLLHPGIPRLTSCTAMHCHALSSIMKHYQALSSTAMHCHALSSYAAWQSLRSHHSVMCCHASAYSASSSRSEALPVTL